MDLLPSVIIFEIIKFTSAKDIFSQIIRLNKNFYESITSSNYLLGIISKQALHLSKELRISYKKTRNLLETLYKAPNENIEFYGFATSGGIDENQLTYWVSNMYQDDGSIYCSRDAKNNINTAGVLKLTQKRVFQPGDRSYDFILKCLNKSKIIRKSIYPRYNEKGIIGLEHIRCVVQLYQESRRNFIHFLKDELKESEKKIQNEMNIASKKINDLKTVGVPGKRRDDNLYVMLESINYDSANNSSKVAVFSSIKFSREGRFTCPIETFMVFVSENYVDIEDPEFDRYDNILSYEELKKNFGSEIKNLQTGEDIEYAQFCNSYRKLKPVIWGKFSGRNGNEINAVLDEYFTGNYLYTKLINPENRMSEMNDNHETTNIDVNFVLGYGKVIDLEEDSQEL
ncbi:hypothetical protein SteCoe_21126 [Stentor coeruleus]|uniref:Uncharacterized protein n=1 Tax=Stentor coeruleus TaxID=5963 RepID=A0A1R2BQE1_9CILI|nr:hypothetical protein SteCoe_21126 [Stentor coeruleus]